MQFQHAILSAAVAGVTEGAAAVVALTGRLDAAGAAEAERRLIALAGPRLLVADLAEVAEADASGLRALLRVAKRIQAEGGRFALCGLAGAVAALFEQSGFGAVIATHPGRADALAA